MHHPNYGRNTQINAAFLMSGLKNADEHAILDAWHGGFVELIYELTAYAEDCEKVCQLLAEFGTDFPGVYAYEVIEPLGLWIGQFIEASKDMPTRQRTLLELASMAVLFFEQEYCDDEKARREAMCARLAALYPGMFGVKGALLLDVLNKLDEKATS